MSDNLKRTPISKWIAGVLCMCMGAALFGGNVATMEKKNVGVYWTPNNGFESFHLTVVGPKGFRIDKTCDTTDISITEFGEDGLYKFELTVNQIKDDHKRDAARDRNSIENTIGDKMIGFSDSGHFRVMNGEPVIDNVKEER